MKILGNLHMGCDPQVGNAGLEKRIELFKCYFNREEDYPHTLSMYRNPPKMNISLQDFETFAYQRAKGLLETG